MVVMAPETPVGRSERLDVVVSAGCINVPSDAVELIVAEVLVAVSGCGSGVVGLVDACRLCDDRGVSVSPEGVSVSPGTDVAGTGRAETGSPTWGVR